MVAGTCRDRGLRAWWLVALVMGAICLLVAAGCGDDAEDGGGAGGAAEATATAEGGDTPEGGGDAGETVEGVPTLEELYKGLEHDPPTQGPPPKQGANVAWLSCGMQVADCSGPANAAKEAARKLGWKFTLVDGNLGQNEGYPRGMRQVLAQDPDAIVVHGIGCDLITEPLREAKEAKIPVIAVESLDCDDLVTNPGPSLYPVEMHYAEEIPNNVAYFQKWGEFNAAYMIQKTGGQAKIINNKHFEGFGPILDEAFKAMIEKCSGCEIVDEVEFGSAELGPDGPWVQRLRPILAKHPDATAVHFPYGGMVLFGAGDVAQALPDAAGVGGSGGAPEVDIVRDGRWTALPAAHSPEWVGYGSMDIVNRHLNGEDTVAQGVGFRVLDGQNNMPPKGKGYQSPIDFVSAYDKLWGVGG